MYRRKFHPQPMTQRVSGCYVLTLKEGQMGPRGDRLGTRFGPTVPAVPARGPVAQVAANLPRQVRPSVLSRLVEPSALTIHRST